ncbi:MAG: GNAT family N-acetyltransferase [Candidatus Omnitrophica bacterium]|nr:GNAT family N-acetyltransferase [Candidatus Omnitrophota bacterium]
MAEEVLIRTFKEQDRQALRTLVADTAYFGSPCEYFFPDRELLADLIMEYYMSYEPDHLWVAEYNTEVIGYLSAGTDEARYSRHLLKDIIPQSLSKTLRRGHLWDKRTARLIWFNLWAFLKAEARLRKVDKKKFPVHIHQNMRDGFRGKGVGSLLVKNFIAFVDKENLGVSFRALRQQDAFPFFERYGFKRLDCRRMTTWEHWLGKSPLYLMEYIRESS